MDLIIPDWDKLDGTTKDNIRGALYQNSVSSYRGNANQTRILLDVLKAMRTVYRRIKGTNINTPIGDMSSTWDILRDAYKVAVKKHKEELDARR